MSNIYAQPVIPTLKSALFPSAADCDETPHKGVRAIGGVEIARQPRSGLLERYGDEKAQMPWFHERAVSMS
jgi:hypothetical protein